MEITKDLLFFLWGEEMDINLFRMAVFEMYHVDSTPVFFPRDLEKFKTRFVYPKWAAEELVDYVSKYVYPRRDISYSDLYSITSDFMVKMENFESIDETNKAIFHSAYLVAVDVLDWLESCGA